MTQMEHGVVRSLFNILPTRRLRRLARSRLGLDIRHAHSREFDFVPYECNCSAIMSSLTVKGKCPHEGACDIDAERADKASGSQQFDGGPYDHGAGSDFDGSERAPHQAYSGGLQQGGRQPHSLTAIEVADRPTLHRTRWRPTWWSWRGPDTRESTTRT